MSEDEFLRATPRKLFKLAEIHQEINNPDPNNKNKKKKDDGVFIDQINL